MTVSALLFAAVAHADRLDPFPWTPYERQFVATVDAYTTTHVQHTPTHAVPKLPSALVHAYPARTGAHCRSKQ